MSLRLRFLLLFLLVSSSVLADDWTQLADGVAYRTFTGDAIRVYVARIDLTSNVRVIATPESQRRQRVSDFAKKNKALVAVNGDYFTDRFQPIGLVAGTCGVWKESKDTTREGLVIIGDGRAQILPQRDVLEQPEPWMETIVSGWPMLVRDCAPLTPRELPGSDAFTRSPHPRTAAGVSKDGKTLYLAVAEGRREGIPGLTLGQLASFLSEELGVCSAMNLDGGGSSAMWVGDRIVNRPSDGFEREVANHLAVVREEDFAGCNDSKHLESPLQSPAAGNRQR